jgi:hypothetical protein
VQGKHRRGVTVIVAAAFALAACDRSSPPEPAPVGKPVTKAEFEQAGLKWPLTIDRGRVGCDGMALWFRSEDGVTYGLNGVANGSGRYAEIEPIWAENAKLMGEIRAAGLPKRPTIRVNIRDLINEASKVCPSFAE